MIKRIATVLILGFGLLPSAASAGAYEAIAPMAQYQSASVADEIAFARTAAPAKIADDAEILAFDGKGYHRAAAGKNGFTCLVQRSWSNDVKNAEFWSPKVRAPICFNAAATRTVLPVYLERTKWVLSGHSLPQIVALSNHHPAPDPERGSMAFMMSKQGYLADGVGPASPHIMIFYPAVKADSWAADLDGSPIHSTPGDKDSITIFYVGVRRWSDGSPFVPK